MVKQRNVVPADDIGILVFDRSKICRRRKRLTRAQALKMLSQKQSESEHSSEPAGCVKDNGDMVAGGSGAVTPGGFINGEASQEFLSTGRTGRRNAMPDILGEHADTGTADLPERLEAVTIDSAGSSGVRSQGEPGPSQQQQHAG